MVNALYIDPKDVESPDVDARYTLIFFKVITLSAALTFTILFLTSIASRGSSVAFAVAQFLLLLLSLSLHIFVRKYKRLRLGASILISALLLVILFMIGSSLSGDASGAYYYVSPVVFITIFTVGVRPAIAIAGAFSLFYLAVAFDFLDLIGIDLIQRVVPVRRQIYIDRLVELVLITVGTLTFQHIKTLQQKAFQKQEKLKSEKDSLEQLSAMACGAAHEINNPLSIINGYLSIMQEKGWLSVQAKSAVEAIYAASERIELFVLSIGSMTSPSHLTLKSCNLFSAIEQSTRIFEKDINAEASIAIDVSDEVYVLADEVYLASILRSISNNALEAISKNDSLSICWRIEDRESEYHLCCEDNGPDYEPDLVTRFTQPLYTTKFDRPRRGLGLTSAKFQLLKLGWGLEIERSRGKTYVRIIIGKHFISYSQNGSVV